MATNTKAFPVMQINRVITVELMMQKLRPHKHGWSALAILAMLVNKRSNGEGPWIEITGVEWKKRTGGTLEKYRGAQALEELGLATVRRDGKRALHFKLATCVDPQSQESKYRKEAAKSKKSSADIFDTPAMREGDAMVVDLFGGSRND